MVSVPLKLNLLIICGQCLGGVFGFVWSTIAYFSFGHPTSSLFQVGQYVKATNCNSLWRCGAPLLPHAGCPIPRYWIPLDMRLWEAQTEPVSDLPEIQDSDDYEAVVQAADSQQPTNHSLSSRSQKRLRAYHLLMLPWANIVTWIMPGIYDFINGRKHT